MGVLYETLRHKFDCWEMEVNFANLERTLTRVRPTDPPEALKMYGEEHVMVSIQKICLDATPDE